MDYTHFAENMGGGGAIAPLLLTPVLKVVFNTSSLNQPRVLKTGSYNAFLHYCPSYMYHAINAFCSGTVYTGIPYSYYHSLLIESFHTHIREYVL